MSKQHTRGIGQVRARSVLDLREIGLADALAQLFPDGVHDFLLSHLAAQAAQGAFNLPQVAHFLAQLHIANRNINIAICDFQQELYLSCFQRHGAEERQRQQVTGHHIAFAATSAVQVSYRKDRKGSAKAAKKNTK
jgi:hypothetical protein